MYGLDDEFDDGMMFTIIYVLLTYILFAYTCTWINKLEMMMVVEIGSRDMNMNIGYLVYFGILKKVVRLRAYWIELNCIRVADPLKWLLYGNNGNWNEEGWALIHTKGHSGPSGICMIWGVRGLLDLEYELTKGSEGNFIFKAHHAHMHLYFLWLLYSDIYWYCWHT